MKEIDFVGTGEKAYYKRLKSGINLYLVPQKNPKNEYKISIQTKYGSAYKNFILDGKEYNINPGSAHFLEHKVFESEDGDVFAKFDKSGSFVNAFTTIYRTKYYVKNNNIKYFYHDLKLLFDLVFNLYLTDELVEKEKGIIKEEINMYDNRPDTHIFRKINHMLFKNHPQREEVLGSSKDIDKMNKEDLTAIYQAFYQPENMSIVIAGSYPEDILDYLDEYKFPENKQVEAPLFFEDKEPVQSETLELEVNENQLYLFKREEADKSLYEEMVETLLYQILFGNCSLFKEAYEKNQKLNGVSFLTYGAREYKMVLFQLLNNDLEASKEFFYKFFDTKISQEDLEREKRLYKSSVIINSDNIDVLEDFMQRNIALYNSTGLDSLKLLDKISLEDIISLQKKLKSEDFSELFVYAGGNNA